MSLPHILIRVCSLIVLVTWLAPAGDRSEPNKFVRVDLELSESILHPGQLGELKVHFSPVAGIHITSDPQMRISLDPKSPFRLNGAIKQSIDSSTSYLSTGEPVIQVFNVPPKTQTGRRFLKGTLTYYFCSDEEGWCRKFVQPFDFPLSIEKPAAQKGKR